MLLITIGKASLGFKVGTTDRLFSTSSARPYSTLETVVISKKLAIRTRNLMQSPNLIDSFSQRYRNTPQKQNHHSRDTETANKDSHRVIFSKYSRRKKEEGRRKKEEGRRKKEEGRRKKEEGRVYSAIETSARGVPNVTYKCCDT